MRISCNSGASSAQNAHSVRAEQDMLVIRISGRNLWDRSVDAPAATISAANPMGTDGMEFVEFAHPDPAETRSGLPADGLHACRPASLQERDALSPG